MNNQEKELILKYDVKDYLENMILFNVEFYLILVHENGVVFFTKEVDDFKINEAINKTLFMIGLNREQIILIQNRKNTYHYLYLTGNKEIINNLEDSFNYLVNERLSELEKSDLELEDFVREVTFNKKNIPYIIDDLKTINSKAVTNKNIKEYEDGTIMIRTSKDNWEVASNEDTLSEFKNTLYLGFLGINKFKKNKLLEGIMYILTGGLFCLGYIEDLIPFWVDTKRDSEGKLYIPINSETKKKFILPQIIMLIVNIIYCAILFFIIRHI